MESAVFPSHHASSSLEKVLEHRFLADLTTELWRRGVRDFEVLRGEVDAHGYDLVVEACGTLRHIQLKAMLQGGKRREVGVSAALARKPSGCVIWMVYDPKTLQLLSYLWFGGAPGDPLPDLGDRIARHSKGDAHGTKAQRAGHRLIGRSRFDSIENIGDLASTLFGFAIPQGSGPEARRLQLALLHESLEAPDLAAPDWVHAVAAGRFDDIPANVAWDDSVHLAHLIDGYALIRKAGWGDPIQFANDGLSTATATGEWPGGPAELWASLFLEHRRWRMSPLPPDAKQVPLLNRLCVQLRSSLL